MIALASELPVRRKMVPRPDTVSSLMIHDVPTIAPEATVLEAFVLLLSRRLRHLPVVMPSGQPVGLVTHVELLQALGMLELRQSLERGRVIDILRPDYATAHPDEPVHEVARRMLHERHECVLVLDDAGALVGLVTERAFLREAVLRR